jgi:aerobic C4-dicarboxylate transport protein
LCIGIAVAHFIQPGKGVDISSIKGRRYICLCATIKRIYLVAFFKREIPTLQILLLAIIAGIWLSRYEKKQQIILPLTIASKYVFKGLHIVMLVCAAGRLWRYGLLL